MLCKLSIFQGGQTGQAESDVEVAQKLYEMWASLVCPRTSKHRTRSIGDSLQARDKAEISEEKAFALKSVLLAAAAVC